MVSGLEDDVTGCWFKVLSGGGIDVSIPYTVTSRHTAFQSERPNQSKMFFFFFTKQDS